MKSIPPIPTAIIAFAFILPSLSQATTVVQWGPDTNMASGGFGFVLEPNSTPQILNLSAPATQTPFTNGGTYYPNNTNNRSPDIYFTGVNTMGTSSTRVLNNTSPANSELRLEMLDLNGASSQVQGAQIIMWTQVGYNYATGPSHGFLNGGDSSQVTLNSISSTFTTSGGADVGAFVYWVIRLGSTFYATGGNNIASGTSLAAPGSALWFEYDPLTDITDTSNSSSAISLSNLDNMTAVGLLLKYDYTSSINIRLRPMMTNFTVDGTIAVPEPGEYALAFGGICMLVVLAYRRMLPSCKQLN